ncbi:MAG: DUF222 domain-containing protein [Candidatus Dormiibacterota bacterium]
MDWGEGGTPFIWAERDVGHDCRDIRAAAEKFCQGPDRASHPAEIGERVVHVSQTIDMLLRKRALMVGEYSKSGLWDDAGFNTDTDWLRHSAQMSYSDAAETLVVGEHIGELPQASEALDEGKIGFGHLVHMARNAAFIARRNTGSFDEAPLLKKALDESVSRFRHTCLNLRHVQDPKGVVEEEANAVEMRELTINRQEDGTTYLNLRLDTPTAAIIALDTSRRSQRLGPDDHRQRARRMADAMIDRLIGEGGPAVEITISGTPDTFLGIDGAPAAELEYVDPISGEMLRRYACNASFTKILLDDKLIPVAAAHSRRMPTRKERQAMDLQQKHCRGRGCHRPASQCSPHHVVWYSRSRRTKISEMILLCPHHHWLVHEGGWDVALKDDGTVLYIPPFARGPTQSIAA